MGTLAVVTPPVAYPVTVDECRDQCRIDGAESDVFFRRLIPAITSHVERVTRRQLMHCVYDYRLDAFPDEDRIYLPRPPTAAVASVKYIDSAGATQTYASDNYTSDASGIHGVIVLNPGRAWPATRTAQHNAVTVRYTAGYAADLSGTLPDDLEGIRHVMLLMIANQHENREPTISGTVIAEIPHSFNSLLWPYVVLNYKAEL